MTSLLRYGAVLLGVLVFAVVLMGCGEGVCTSCAHACCLRSERIGSEPTLVRRLLSALGFDGVAAVFAAAPLRLATALAPPGPSATPLASGTSPLRI